MIDELALAAERREGLVTVGLVVGQGFSQQGLGGLGVLTRRVGVHLAETQQQQPGGAEQSLHVPSLVLIDVTTA